MFIVFCIVHCSAAEYTDGVMSANAMVENNGNVFWPIPTKLQSSCKVDVTYFPFDDQICKMKFGSWTYDGFQVDITNRSEEVDLSNYVVNGEWVLISVKVQRNVVYYTCCPESFPDVTFFVHIRRRTLYYMYNVIFPCIMMSALTLLVFCLPPDSGEKIALGITVLLAFSVFMLAVAENLPETSEFVPLISKCCCISYIIYYMYLSSCNQKLFCIWGGGTTIIMYYFFLVCKYSFKKNNQWIWTLILLYNIFFNHCLTPPPFLGFFFWY